MYLKILTILFIGIIMAGCSNKELTYNSKYYEDGIFKNPDGNFEKSLSEHLSLFWYFFTDDTKGKVPSNGEVPVNNLTNKDILAMDENSVVRFGHSTLLFKIDSKYILVDPVFGERTSPLPFMGPKRFHQNPASIEELPFIDILIISHNHYDHLDEYTIKKLKDKVGKVYTTLGLTKKLTELGVDSSKIFELDWWDKKLQDTTSIVATPAQHFSGRGLLDRNETFWASWVIKGSKVNIYYSADSGYFKEFKNIGEKYGPFDMTFIETGAYNERWANIHMMPKQSVQAHIDLKGKIMFPVHNGTFELSTHPWKEPFELVTKAAKEREIKITHPIMGEIIPILEYTQTKRWWE